MKNVNYSKLMKIVATTAAITCSSFEATIANAKEQDTSSATPIVSLLELETMENARKNEIVMKGQRESYTFTNSLAEFYGLNKEEVHQIFLDHYDTIANGDAKSNLMNILEETIATGEITPEHKSEIALGTRDMKRIHEVKNSEIGTLFQKYCNRYGIDINLALAQFNQESGLKQENYNAEGAYGITQIEHTLFGSTVNAYNFETNTYETIKITEEKARNLESNIQIGIAKLQERMKDYHYNVLMGLQSYNYGGGMFDKVLERYEERTGDSRDNLITSFCVSDWKEDIDYVHKNPSRYTREAAFQNGRTYGDNDYIEHVFSYLETPFLTFQLENGKTLRINVETGVCLDNQMIRLSEPVEIYIEYMYNTENAKEKRMML